MLRNTVAYSSSIDKRISIHVENINTFCTTSQQLRYNSVPNASLHSCVDKYETLDFQYFGLDYVRYTVNNGLKSFNKSSDIRCWNNEMPHSRY